jgi:muconate cycloisomerase
MKIKSILLTEVRVPMHKGYVDSAIHGDSTWKHLPKWIIELQFDNGMVGLGESPRGVMWPEVEVFGKFLIDKRLADLRLQRFFIPQEADNDMLAPASSKVPSRSWEYEYLRPYAYYGFEVALLDALGKVAGLPVSFLLGGAWRDRVLTSFWIGRMVPEDAARQAALARKLGFTAMKIKASIEDPLADVIGAMKQAAGEPFPIVIDPNNRFFHLTEALAMARKLDRFEDISYEDPFPYQKDEWKEFRSQTRRPLVWHTADPWTAAQDRACDYVNLSSNSNLQTRFLAETAAQFRLLHWQGTGLDLGILDAMRLHCSAASRTCVLPGDAIGHRIRESDLIVEKLKVENGHILVPTGPGLGVTLDREAMKRYQLRQEKIS